MLVSEGKARESIDEGRLYLDEDRMTRLDRLLDQMGAMTSAVQVHKWNPNQFPRDTVKTALDQWRDRSEVSAGLAWFENEMKATAPIAQAVFVGRDCIASSPLRSSLHATVAI